MRIRALGSKYQPIFATLERAGFSCVIEEGVPKAFDNFRVNCASHSARLRVTNDRGQVFIEIAATSGEWLDKEVLLDSVGVPRTRHPTKGGLWVGYEPAVQATELEKYLPMILGEAARALPNKSLERTRER